MLIQDDMSDESLSAVPHAPSVMDFRWLMGVPKLNYVYNHIYIRIYIYIHLPVNNKINKLQGLWALLSQCQGRFNPETWEGSHQFLLMI